VRIAFAFNRARKNDISSGCCKLGLTIQPQGVKMSCVTAISTQQIQQAILTLSDIEKTSLLHWFIQTDKQLWDQQLEADFSENGPGAALLERIKKDFQVDTPGRSWRPPKKALIKTLSSIEAGKL
jgi:hypothetical protein